MTLKYILIFTFFLNYSVIFPQKNSHSTDSLNIVELNKKGYASRLQDPLETIKLGWHAYRLASAKGYKNEMAEASRIIGIGYYNLNQVDSSIVKYLSSLSVYKETGNIEGQARVYNNIGNLYREVDYIVGLKYFNLSLKLAERANLQDLIAGTHLNIGIIYHRKKMFDKALANFDKSLNIFSKLKNAAGIIPSLQNKGVVYFETKQIAKAEKFLTEANQKAKEKKLNKVVASINLTLTDVYIAKRDFKKAELIRNEGVAYAKLAKSQKLEHDYLIISYELENQRKNYKEAVYYLRELYKTDSVAFDNAKSDQIKLSEAQFKFQQKEKENQIIIERQKRNTILLIASIIVSLLAFILILLLVKNVRKKAQTNKQLQLLNEEVSLQKENLNKVNHNLEVIIDERTKDLQIKNRKLSEYSSHLSHQIRGPIATMKGLMILEKEKLIEESEFVTEISRCVNEIDDKIININEVLHNIQMPGLIPKPVDKENKS